MTVQSSIARVELPWPPSDVSPNAQKRWSEKEVALLCELHGEIPLAQIAVRLNRPKTAIRAKITRLGIAKKSHWTAEEEDALRALYEDAGKDGVLKLTDFSGRIGRHKANVCRKAKALGLERNYHRAMVEERKVRVRQFATNEALGAHISARTKKLWATRGHPRGMLGKKHSPETLKRVATESRRTWAARGSEEQAEFSKKCMKAKVEKYGSQAPNVRRGSWKAGWREVGGRRVFFRSRWEANYARYLQWLKERGEIQEWEHEPETFWFEAIKRGVRSYLPDFRVTENCGRADLHEVKGWMDSRSRTTLRRMKKYYPQYPVLLIEKKAYRAIEAKVSRLIPGWEQ